VSILGQTEHFQNEEHKILVFRILFYCGESKFSSIEESTTFDFASQKRKQNVFQKFGHVKFVQTLFA